MTFRARILPVLVLAAAAGGILLGLWIFARLTYVG
jgi:hypothetical protein